MTDVVDADGVRAVLAPALAAGQSLENALLECVRARYDAGERRAARALVELAGELEGGARARALGRLLVAHAGKRWQLASVAMSDLGDEDVARHLAVAGVETCLRAGDEESRARLRRIVECAAVTDPATRIGVAARLLAAADRATAARLVADLDDVRAADLPDDVRRQLGIVRRELQPPALPAAPASAVRLGLLDHRHPDQAHDGGDVADHLQSLGLVVTLAALCGGQVTGEAGLADLVTEVRDRLGPAAAAGADDRAVHLVTVDRDWSTRRALGGPVWTVVHGWHMHPLFDLRHDFPPAPEVRPLYVSFHVARPSMLTDDALEHLREHGPVGCRDWTTVDLLLSAGVPAFFTGCLSTTLDVLSRSSDDKADSLTGLVGVPRRIEAAVAGPTRRIAYGDALDRDAGLAQRLRGTLDLLDRYQECSHLVTSRLQTYLAATTLDVPVTFRPARRTDVRLEGLMGLRPGGPRLRAMRDDLRSLLREVLTLVLAGAPEDVVRQRWRALTAPKVERARQQLASDGQVSPMRRPGLSREVELTRAEARSYGATAPGEPPTDVAMSVDARLVEHLPVALESLVRSASGPLRLWVTTRGVDEAGRTRLSALFPAVAITFLPCDHVGYAELPRVLDHITPTTMDRLLLPDLLPDVDRLVYLDVDLVVLDDIAALARTDLGGHPLAARSAHGRALGVWRAAGHHLPPREAFALRRTMAARQPFATPTLNAGVLVLDLARMRADDFTSCWLPFAEQHGLNDQDALLAYAGHDRAEIPARWNAWPTVEPVVDPAIVHYLGPDKPWLPGTPLRHHWQRHAESVARRERDRGGAGPGLSPGARR